ncbi:MAG: hypothetical protein EBR67_03565 [Proteobacteria bacterium]|nr:hypothetical protein [Pseudomonadota bacterium]
MINSRFFDPSSQPRVASASIPPSIPENFQPPMVEAPTPTPTLISPLMVSIPAPSNDLARENSYQRYPNLSKDDLEQIIEDFIDDENLSINNL